MAPESLDATIPISDDVLRPLAKPLTDGRRRDGWGGSLPGPKPSCTTSGELSPALPGLKIKGMLHTLDAIAVLCPRKTAVVLPYFGLGVVVAGRRRALLVRGIMYERGVGRQ